MTRRNCGRKRDNVINVRVTDNEKIKIEYYASMCGLSVSEYLRQLAMGKVPRQLPSDEFFESSSKITALLEKYERDKSAPEFVASLKNDVEELVKVCKEMGLHEIFDEEVNEYVNY